ncbi:MAG: deoxyribonuclease IV [Deltaproteobacteria bacterium]|nr:deoxyribonuclease IV [Deltaproteobacteria bacterium]MBI3079033.1 deoxyribonuclease IV [Deltaproteobacteria bacterium]
MDNLGAHMSIQGGLHEALIRGKAVGCGVVQIFLKNQVQWAAKPLTPDEIAAFKQAQRETGIRTVFAHDTYLINLGSPNETDWKRSMDTFFVEMERAEAVEVPYLVFHPGAHMGAGPAAGIRRIARALNLLLRRGRGFRVRLLLENTAGQGSLLGSTFEELRAIMDGVHESERLGLCLDTCHLLAAGYDIRDRDGYERTMAACDRLIGLEQVRAFHLNDAKKGLGSHLDRHEHIGKGEVGLEAFRLLMNDHRFHDVPMALETPKEGDMDVENLRVLRNLRATARPRARRASRGNRGAGAQSRSRDERGAAE